MLIKTKFEGYQAGIRLYPGGGGGGGDPGADARRAESERQERIKAATEEINRVFNEQTLNNAVAGTKRDAMYKDQRASVYELNSNEVDRQAGVAGQANRFGLARSGLAGGSVDIDSNAELDRRTNEGLLRAGGIADQSAADLKAADERTRSSLISMAQSGIDTGSAATMALNGLKVNADSVAAQRSGSTVGNLFNDMSQAYLYNQKGLGLAGGSSGSSMYANPYQQSQQFGSMDPRSGSSGQVG
jgi:hypothetical protein